MRVQARPQLGLQLCINAAQSGRHSLLEPRPRCCPRAEGLPASPGRLESGERGVSDVCPQETQ